MTAPFLAVVGPSGVGKDTLIDAVHAARPRILRVRRVITRSAEAGGERAEAVDDVEFERRAAGGAFALHWRAHGLRYGIPASVEAALARGQPAIANLSRGALGAAQARFAPVHVFAITAMAGTRARRLLDRGREDQEAIVARLRRVVPVKGQQVTRIDNNDTVEAALAEMLVVIDGLYPPNGADARR